MSRRQKKAVCNRAKALSLERILWLCALVCLLPLIATSAMKPVVTQIPQSGTTEPAAQKLSLDPSLPTVNPEANSPDELISDRADWSVQRISAFEKLLNVLSPERKGTLILSRQQAHIPVFAGTSEFAMTMGAGHLSDTAPLDGNGNIAISAHRDGTFRVLKDVQVGDLIQLETGGQFRHFKVTGHQIVMPDRVDVLDPTPVTSLTLITCYPFYFVGSAPKRFVLRAELVDAPGVANTPHPVGPHPDRTDHVF